MIASLYYKFENIASLLSMVTIFNVLASINRINLPLCTCCHQDKFTINPSCMTVGAISATSYLPQKFNLPQRLTARTNAPFRQSQIEVYQ